LKTATVVGTFVKNFTKGKQRKEQGTFVTSSLRTRSGDFLTVKPPLCENDRFFLKPYALNFKIISELHINFFGQMMVQRNSITYRGQHNQHDTTQYNTPQQIEIYLKASNSFLVNNS
jgi:hypothetical protein